MASTPDDGALPDGAARAADGLDADARPPASEGTPANDPAAGGQRSRPVPSEAELDRLAVDVRIRRRPRYGVFIALGMLVVGVAALLWTTSVPQESHVNWGSTVWVTTLGAVGFGALIGAGVAVLADWLSRRK